MSKFKVGDFVSIIARISSYGNNGQLYSVLAINNDDIVLKLEEPSVSRQAWGATKWQWYDDEHALCAPIGVDEKPLEELSQQIIEDNEDKEIGDLLVRGSKIKPNNKAADWPTKEVKESTQAERLIELRRSIKNTIGRS